MGREELYKAFGPKLVEALAEVIRSEINVLRLQHGLAERTKAQMVSAIESKLATIADYDWMG